MASSLLLEAASSGVMFFAAVFIEASWMAANSFPHTKPIRKTSTNVKMSAAVAMPKRSTKMF